MPRNDEWNHGFETARREWEAAREAGVEPEFRNKFPIGSSSELGYEEFVFLLQNPAPKER